MEKKVRMADIAERLGISTVTVSRALSGKDGVSETVRAKICQAASDLGYQGKIAAPESLEGETVGVLIHERFLSKDQSFYLSLYERVVANLAKYNMFGLLEAVLWEEERDLVKPRFIQSNRVQSLIIIGSMEVQYVNFIQNLGLPVVRLDAYDASSSLDTVISDGYYGMYRMTSYLLQRGHRKIAYLGSVGATSSITDRYHGYCRAMQENGAPLRPEWVLPDRDAHGYFAIELPREMPTAFVCNCDAAAYHLIRLLTEKGYRIPEEVSVVAFDDFLYSELSNPRITTYAVDMDGMARASVRQLQARRNHPEREQDFRVITGFLREKESVTDIHD